MIVENLINQLNLLAHPEGGYYSETYRSDIVIPGKDRDLMTSIYFLLTSDNVSRFHRIKSDELWFFHSGSPLVVHTLDERGHSKTLVGNNFEKGETPYFMVPKNTIFGSSVLEKDSYSLVSCVVAPGFDFRDFELFDSVELVKQYPREYEIISKLTS